MLELKFGEVPWPNIVVIKKSAYLKIFITKSTENFAIFVVCGEAFLMRINIAQNYSVLV